MKLFAVTVAMTRNVNDRSKVSLVSGAFAVKTEHEAVGEAVAYCMKEYPGYVVGSYSVIEVGKDLMRQALEA